MINLQGIVFPLCLQRLGDLSSSTSVNGKSVGKFIPVTSTHSRIYLYQNPELHCPHFYYQGYKILLSWLNIRVHFNGMVGMLN